MPVAKLVAGLTGRGVESSASRGAAWGGKGSALPVLLVGRLAAVADFVGPAWAPGNSVSYVAR